MGNMTRLGKRLLTAVGASLLIATAAFLLIGFISIAGAEVATLAFKSPTQRTDGTALNVTEIARFDFRCVDFRPTGGAFGPCNSAPVYLLNYAATMVNITVNVPATGGDACFDGMATLKDGAKSEWGNDVCTTYPPAPPPPVTVSKLVYEKQGQRFNVVGSVALGVACGTKIGSYFALARNVVTITSRKYRNGTPLGVCK